MTPSYRVIGCYADNRQIYDGDADGEDVGDAVLGLRDAMYDEERENLMIVAVLDTDGANLYGGDKAFPIKDWEEVTP